ncbi:MAG TPA: hypothetical protein V6C76_08875 [Drouetiella sp.]
MDPWEKLASRFFDLWRNKGDDWLEKYHKEMMRTVKTFAAKQGGVLSEGRMYKSESDIPKINSGNTLIDMELRQRIIDKLKFPMITVRYRHWTLLTRVLGPAEFPLIFPGKVMLISQGTRFVPKEDFQLTVVTRGNSVEWLSKPLENVIRLWPELKEINDRKPRNDSGVEVKSGHYDVDSRFVIKTSHPKLVEKMFEKHRIREKILASRMTGFAVTSNIANPEQSWGNVINFFDIVRINSAEEMSTSNAFFRDLLDALFELDLITADAPTFSNQLSRVLDF